MRKIGELMQELGFKKDAPDSVKKAFIKNLIKEAYGAPVEDLRPRTKVKNKNQSLEKKKAVIEQLSFQLQETDKDIA